MKLIAGQSRLTILCLAFLLKGRHATQSDENSPALLNKELATLTGKVELAKQTAAYIGEARKEMEASNAKSAQEFPATFKNMSRAIAKLEEQLMVQMTTQKTALGPGHSEVVVKYMGPDNFSPKEKQLGNELGSVMQDLAAEKASSSKHFASLRSKVLAAKIQHAQWSMKVKHAIASLTKEASWAKERFDALQTGAADYQADSPLNAALTLELAVLSKQIKQSEEQILVVLASNDSADKATAAQDAEYLSDKDNEVSEYKKQALVADSKLVQVTVQVTAAQEEAAVEKAKRHATEGLLQAWQKGEGSAKAFALGSLEAQLDKTNNDLKKSQAKLEEASLQDRYMKIKMEAATEVRVARAESGSILEMMKTDNAEGKFRSATMHLGKSEKRRVVSEKAAAKVKADEEQLVHLRMKAVLDKAEDEKDQQQAKTALLKAALEFKSETNVTENKSSLLTKLGEEMHTADVMQNANAMFKAQIQHNKGAEPVAQLHEIIAEDMKLEASDHGKGEQAGNNPSFLQRRDHTLHSVKKMASKIRNRRDEHHEAVGVRHLLQ